MNHGRPTRREVVIFGLVAFALLICLLVRGQPTLPPIPYRSAIAKVRASITVTTNGTNVVICGTNKFGKPFCITNPPAPVPPRTNFLMKYDDALFPAGEQVTNGTGIQLAGAWLQSAPSPAGPWSNCVFVPTSGGINRQVAFPLSGTARFFRPGSNVWTNVTLPP